METAILEVCHGYFRIAVFKDGIATIVPDKYGNNKTPARIYLQEGVSAVGYNPKWGEGTVRVDNICDSSTLLSDCVAQIRNSKISGREIAEKFLGHVASTAGAFLYDVIDTIAAIVPNTKIPLQHEDAALPEAMSLLPGKYEVNIRNRNKRMNLFTSSKNNDEADEIKPSPVIQPTECSRDELFSEAVELVFSNGEGSIPMLQKEFRIIYGRAAEVVDRLEKAGLLSAYNGKPRKLLMTREQWEEEANHRCSHD